MLFRSLGAAPSRYKQLDPERTAEYGEVSVPGAGDRELFIAVTDRQLSSGARPDQDILPYFNEEADRAIEEILRAPVTATIEDYWESRPGPGKKAKTDRMRKVWEEIITTGRYRTAF